MGTGFAKRKKQAKQLQEQFLKMQEEMKNAEFTGSAGNGLVELVINGDQELKSIKIKPECVDPDDVEGLEDLIKAAFEDATKKAKESAGPMDAMGMGGIPGMPDLSQFGL
ncbi:MAG: nucleoid-associated protein [Waddliaceae bacterium]|nr:nucleoid-associated protein [Waddliaceae bacterium]